MAMAVCENQAGRAMARATRRLFLAVALAWLAAAGRGLAPAQSTFTEAGGTVVIEAELGTLVPHGTTHGWVYGVEATAGGPVHGGAYISAEPNIGTNNDATFRTACPELTYQLQVTRTGTYYVWVRGFGATDNDDSIHIAVGDANAPAQKLYLNGVVGQWTWSNALFGGAAGAVVSFNFPTAGSYTLRIWMREDGVRLDQIFLTQKATLLPQVGNAFHIPSNQEPTGRTMRAPWPSITPGTDVTIINGGQYQGTGGDPGNQLQSASALFWRVAGSGSAWTRQAMTFLVAEGNNKYYAATIPGGSLVHGATIEYYIRAAYDDHLYAYLHGGDDASTRSEFETAAQAAPYSFLVESPVAVTGVGPTEDLNWGAWTARLYLGNGTVELIGPDRAGNPTGLRRMITAPSALVGGGQRGSRGARVLSTLDASDSIGPGVSIEQGIGDTSVTAILRFLTPSIVRYEVVDWRGLAATQARIRIGAEAGERYWGLGERFNVFEMTGRSVRMVTLDYPGTKGDAAYKPVPWMLSKSGYGVRLAIDAESQFDLLKSRTDACEITAYDKALAWEFVGGPHLTDVVARFTDHVGRPYLPPAWAFAPWMSSDIWRNGGEVRYLLTQFLQRDIPVSVLVFDSPWERAYNDFTWNTAQFAEGGSYGGSPWTGFANVGEMMEFLRHSGVKAICWMTPFVNVSSVNQEVTGQNTGKAATYDEGAANGYFVRQSPGGAPLVVPWWKGNGSPVDFTNPAAVTWFKAQLQRLVDESRVALAGAAGETEPVIGGFKTDDGETGNGSNLYIPLSASYFDGRTGVQMRNGFCVEYHKTVSSVLGENGVLFARAGYTGTGAYPAGWAGDNEPNFTAENGLPSAIVAGQSSAVSGFLFWSHDIGGYQDSNHPANPEDLFRRWTQFGAFSPLMQMHRQVGSGRQYPWSYGESGTVTYRKYSKLRNQLFPYIYSTAKQAVDRGLPMIRPLVLMYPDDPLVWGIQHTYEFGDAFLVAPIITENATARNVYMPESVYYDFWNNTRIVGRQNHLWSNTDVSLFPVFVRAGAIIPMLATIPQTLLPANYVDNAAVSSPGSAWKTVIYAQSGDGVSSAALSLYDGGAIAWRRPGSGAPALEVTMTGGQARPVEFEVRIGAAEAPTLLKLADGSQIAPVADASAFAAAAAPAWFHDAPAQALRAKVAHGGATAPLATSLQFLTAPEPTPTPALTPTPTSTEAPTPTATRGAWLVH